MKRFMFFILSLTMVVSSCKKNADKVPGLSLKSPLNGQDIATNDSILIEGTATDNDGLHEFYLTITAANGDTVLYNAPYVHNLKTFTFKYHYHPTDTGDYHARIDVSDHDANLVTRSFDFHASYPPVITLTAPNDSAVINLSDSLYIAGTATHNIGLKKLSLLIINYITLDTAFNQSTDLNNITSYNFSSFFHPVDTGYYFIQARVTNYKDEPATQSRRFWVHQ